jgi:L-alanine-DL-glutamate epimerase-like enolase superfamily enzyme
MAIYADGNGSFDVPMAIKTGRLMEQYKLAFFEEPRAIRLLRRDQANRRHAHNPDRPRREEMSLRGFRRIIESNTAQVVQPDLLYFGGMIRSIKVSRMAAAAGIDCTPHMSGGGLGFLYIAHFASCVPNIGAHQEYKGEDDTLPVSSPTSPSKA